MTAIELGEAKLEPLDEASTLAFQESVHDITDAVNGFMQGKSDVVDVAMICLLAEGHLLLEDVPGVGKTSLARCLAAALGIPWQRIQFTPDLLPSDVTGVSVFHSDSNSFIFHPGPVFSNVVLADEVNRASPRTQSALLEVMEERQVTVDGAPHPVPRPFLVIATQNPIEMDGTYPLPEAQLDRFLMKSTMGYPDLEAEVRVLQASHSGGGLDSVRHVSTTAEVAGLIRDARRIHVGAELFEYMATLTAFTRSMAKLRLGSSPRGALGLLRASRVRAAMHGRPYVEPRDIQELAVPVLGHRVLLSPSFEAAGGTTSDAVREAVEMVPAPPAS
jgi:MoxR-like ATPase